MGYDISGEIVSIGDTQQVSDKFKKREVVITFATNPQYPEFVAVEFVQDKTELPNAFKVGQRVVVGIDLGGRQWTNPSGVVKTFNSVKGWRIALQEGQQQTAQPAQEIPPMPKPGSYSDEIPF